MRFVFGVEVPVGRSGAKNSPQLGPGMAGLIVDRLPRASGLVEEQIQPTNPQSINRGARGERGEQYAFCLAPCPQRPQRSNCLVSSAEHSTGAGANAIGRLPDATRLCALRFLCALCALRGFTVFLVVAAPAALGRWAETQACRPCDFDYVLPMIPTQISESALALPDQDRLTLARMLIESVASERHVVELIDQGVRRMEDVILGRVAPLSEAEFRAALR